MSRRRVSCGLEQSHVADLSAALSSATDNNYDFITIPIVNPRLEREFDTEKAAASRQGPLTFSDLLLNSNDWSTLVVGRLSPSLDVDRYIIVRIQVQYLRNPIFHNKQLSVVWPT